VWKINAVIGLAIITRRNKKKYRKIQMQRGKENGRWVRATRIKEECEKERQLE
jgi:hypothetical protein